MGNNTAHQTPAKEKASEPLPRTTCSLFPCGCGGKVGSRAAVKFHPRLNLMDGTTRYDVRCARCKKVATTKDGKGFQNWKAALRAWNHKANANVDLPDTAAQDSASKSSNPAVSG